MKCSVCFSEIAEKYCSNCGQYFESEMIIMIFILKDLFGNIFSMEKYFFRNIKLALLDPKVLVSNYWQGYRGYY